jgi:hypothetical protein
MASFPGSKVHRVSRRQLGRGQHVQLAAVTLTAVASTVTVTVTASAPIILSGRPAWITNTGSIVSFAQTSATVFTLTFTSSQAAASYALAAGDPNIRTPQGGSNTALSGTF